MTWTKLGSEFSDECAHVDLSDAAYRTHVEAIAYVYKMRRYDCQFAKRAMRRFATSDRLTEAIKELLDHGFWVNRGEYYELIHHAEVITDSLTAQDAKRDRDRKAQQAARERKARAAKEEAPEPEVSDRVSADTRQTDRQTDKQLGSRSEEECSHGIPMGDKPDSWFSEGMACADCARERKGA